MYSSGRVSYRRLALSACLLSLFLISWLYLPATRLTRQHLSSALATHKKNPFATSTTTPQQDQEKTNARVELVVSSVKAENTSWITDNFPHYPAHIYVADDPYAPLTVKHNIGHESTVYLTYIIDNYHKLPDVVIFIHGRRYQWHNEDPLYDGVPVLQRFRIPYVLSHGFATLRCSWLLGCPLEMRPNLEAAARWDDPGADQRLKTEATYAKAYTQLFPGQPIPEAVGVHCGAQFAVTRERILNRTLEDYKSYRQWLWTTELTDEFSGRVMEYSWHQILGQPAVDCPNAGTCFCAKFGLCDLKCEEHGCKGRYFFNFGELPAKWPEEGTGENGWPDRFWHLYDV
ncbi:clathrin heavy chain [Apiospora arundinis]